MGSAMDYVLIAFTGIVGFGDGPWYFIVVVAVLLTLLSAARHKGLARRYSEYGPARVFAVFATASIANNLVFAAMSFGFGRGIAWLISI